MNASKAKKEASEKKAFLNHKIAHGKPFPKLFSYKYVKSVRVSSILFRLPVNNNLIGVEIQVTYIHHGHCFLAAPENKKLP